MSKDHVYFNESRDCHGKKWTRIAKDPGYLPDSNNSWIINCIQAVETGLIKKTPIKNLDFKGKYVSQSPVRRDIHD